MKKVVAWSGLIILLSSPFSEWSNNPVFLIDSESSIGTKENPKERAEFEFSKIRNPRTGTVPENIRQKEIEFSKQHLSRAAQRIDGTDEEIWELAGPFNVGGRTRALVLDALNENTFISGGVSGGVWKSTNAGSSWTRTSDPENRNSLTTIAQDTREGKENIWYYGTGELVGNSPRGGGAPYRGDGIFKSVDSGENWSQLTSTKDSEPSVFGSQFQYIWRIVTNHKRDDADELFAAAYGGILRSEDGGDSWSTVLGEELNNLPEGTDLNESIAPFYTDVAKNTAGHFYATLSHSTSDSAINYSDAGIYWSEDGDEWFNISPPGFSNFDLSRTIISAVSDQAYFFSNRNDFAFLIRYEFNGTTPTGTPIGTWTDLSDNLPDFEGIAELDVQNGYNMMIQIHPDDPDLIFLGGTNLYRSTDGFTSKNNITLMGGYEDSEDVSIYANHHPDQHDVIFSPSGINKLFSINDGGIYVTQNSSSLEVSWTSLNNGYVTSQFYTVNIPKDESNDIITGGMQDNGSQVTNSGNGNAFWTRVIGGDGAYSGTVPQGIYTYMSFQKSRIFRLSLNESFQITSFARVDPTDGASRTDSEYLFVNPYVLDPTNSNIMYLAGGNAIWRNNNLAQIPGGVQETTDVNWDLFISTILTQETITAMEITNDSEYLYYGTNSTGLLRLDDPRNSEERVRLTQTSLPRESYVSCIAANPENSSEIVTVLSNYSILSIFHSTNAGESFQDISGSLEEFSDGSGNGPSVRWAEIVPMESGATRYFVGTSIGLYSTDALNGQSTVWVKESTDKIGKAVVVMMDYRPLDGRFVVATHGNGMFRTTIDGFKPIVPITEGAEKFAVSKSFPNPFSKVTSIEFDIPETDFVQVDVFDMFGRHVRNLLTVSQYGGKNTVSWDGKNQFGEPMKDGMYIYRISYDGKIVGGRMVYNP